MIKYLLQITFLFNYILVFPNLSLSSALTGNHPRLILTPEKIESLKTGTTQKQLSLWKLALQNADELSRESIPEMKEADNAFRYIGEAMPALGLAYWMTNDINYVKSAEKWISALLAVPEWKGSQNLGRSAWVVGCALLYDWLYEFIDQDLRLKIKNRFLAEATILMNTAAIHRALSNHLLIETTALGMTGLVLQGETEQAETFLRQADEWANYIINYAPIDGSWGEGVQYWQYGLGYFLRYLEACRSFDYKDYYPQYDWLKKTGFFPIYFSLPARPTEVINFSDCGSKRTIPAFLLYIPASRYKNGYFQDYGTKVENGESHKLSWMDFIAYDATIIPQDIYSLPTLKHFSDNDFVTMRSGWEEEAMTVGFRCGPAPGHRNQNHPLRLENRGFGPGHGHPDINSLNIFAYGEWLAIDPGYTYTKLTQDHNTVMVNSFGQAGAGDKWLDYMAFEAREPVPTMLRVESNSAFDYLIGDAGNIYIDEANVKKFRRHLLFLKPDIVIVADDLEAKDKSKFEWLVNASDSIHQIDNHHFEIIKNQVRLWIYPLLPKAYQAEIQSRRIKASDIKIESGAEEGVMKTLNLSAVSDNKVHFLVILCALKDSSTLPPDVTFSKNRVNIKHKNHSWRIKYQENIKKVSDPFFIVQQPNKGEQFYYFVKEK